ncbi:hypothetical protein FUA23_00310 [Neolewinella aurantiaca]|uniref:Lipoprotein n=1 Tax=Neolewinella aurantiaca TaxID=2602767 RepID=A0A5C7FLS7_9BACT|nr:hypothetical protein [Neolewinella aurantiaca]TXF91660.1 hypothetical protein FUA23_00310 [Neolewinella aurantiaca]
MKLFFMFLLFLFLTSCSDDEDNRPVSDCGPYIEILSSTDGLDPGDAFALADISTEGTCLSIEVSATGCNPDDWTAELVTDGAVAESIPTQTNARFILDRQLPDGASICQAIAFKTFTFDLSDYLTPGALPSNLRLVGPADTARVILFEE